MADDANLFTTDRIARAQQLAGAAGIDALLVSPGPDLRYLTGYAALPLERLTCLVTPTEGEPFLVVPLLEKPRPRCPRSAVSVSRSLDGARLKILTS